LRLISPAALVRRGWPSRHLLAREGGDLARPAPYFYARKVTDDMIGGAIAAASSTKYFIAPPRNMVIGLQ
jgi:hypothetical protein